MKKPSLMVQASIFRISHDQARAESVAPRKILFFIIVLFCFNALMVRGAFPAVDGFNDLFTDEENMIRAALKDEFAKMGPRAHVLRGTPLYLYNPHRSEYYNMNSLGFRGEEVTPKKKNGFNIMVLGGSTVFGAYQSDSQTIPAYLEERLREKHPERDIRVYNLGVEGYAFQREIALAKLLRAQLNPDLVIFYHGANDLIYFYRYGRAVVPPFDEKEEANFVKRNRTSGDIFALEHERLSSKLRRKFLRSRDEWDAEEASFVEGYFEHVEDVAKYFKGGNSVNKKNIPVLFVIQPTVFTRKNRTPREQVIIDACKRPNYSNYVKECVMKVMEFARSKGITIHEFTGVFDEYEGELFKDEVHVNVAGNNIVSKRLADLILKGGYLDAGN